jgi:hypothetical protein
MINGKAIKLVSGGIPDIWEMDIDDNRVVLLTTFSNTPNQQAYPNFYSPGAGLPAKGQCI